MRGPVPGLSSRAAGSWSPVGTVQDRPRRQPRNAPPFPDGSASPSQSRTPPCQLSRSESQASPPPLGEVPPQGAERASCQRPPPMGCIEALAGCPLSHGCRRASSPRGGAKSRLPLWGALVPSGHRSALGLRCRVGRCWTSATGRQHPRRQPRPLMASSMPRRFSPRSPVTPPKACTALWHKRRRGDTDACSFALPLMPGHDASPSTFFIEGTKERMIPF